ncbi:hypothetical protein QRD02_12015 [Aequorivita sp. SDUM287046]|uniref:Uncharacterized protein n=1 Tax=Aequorivita aurantiaca TaxID=3053356 RepID=A0ABT8DJK9_9FLAO|nr:hypothetical protein [Aequorivita aurantiaca]MDN3725112.1 hypothetical protein [Aequorivita aurantiaca]
MKKSLYILLTIIFYHLSGNAQVVDVFQNKEYEYSTYVLEATSNKEYAPSKLEIYQDKNKEENKNWQNIESQLNTIALQQIENEIAFFQLHTKAVNYLKQLEELKRLENPRHEGSKFNPSFKNLKINLVSVVNNRGVYFIQYNFDDVHVKNYYLADYQNNKVIEINEAPNVRQQEALKKSTLSRLTALYLLQTKKLEVSNVERIRATQSEEEKLPDFSNRVDYSEALVYPYFSGLMIEFPANSKSSGIFDNKAFRVLVTGKELTEVLDVFPDFKPIFRQPLKHPTKSVIEILNNDQNFDLSRFSRAPKELQLLESLPLSQTDKKPFSLTISNYQKSDTIKKFIGAKKFLFDENGTILRIEERNDRNDIAREEKYSYNESNQLTDIRILGYGNNLKLQNYDNDLLSYVQTIEIEDYQNAYGKELRDLNIHEQHFAYNTNYRYVLEFNVVGDFDQYRTIQSRHIADNGYCTYNFCLLTNNDGQVIAVKKNTGSPMDILLNSKGQPIESYLDNNRHHHKFTYDDSDRIKTFSTISDRRNTNFNEYQYHGNIEKPVTITETKSDHSTTILIQEYEIAFWED